MARLPLVLLGLRDESQVVAVRLFEAYEEKEAFPVAFFRALLAPAHGAASPPEVYDAKLSVRLRLGTLGGPPLCHDCVCVSVLKDAQRSSLCGCAWVH